MIWQDFYDAYDSWDDDAIERNMPSAEEVSGAAADQVFEVAESIGDDNLRAALMKRALVAGIIFTADQVAELVNMLPRDIANELFSLYADKMGFHRLEEVYGSVDDDLYQRALRSWAISSRPTTWAEYYESATSIDLGDELSIARLADLTAYGPVDEVYDGALLFINDEQRSIYVDKALAAGVRFDREQTIELMNGVRRETANRLYWAYGKKLTRGDLDEIEGLVDDEVFEQARKGVLLTREPIRWDDFINEYDEWDDDLKLHKASRLTSFGDADEVAEVAQSFINQDMAARFVEIAIRKGVQFAPQSRKAGFFNGLFQVAGALAIADWAFGGDQQKQHGDGVLGDGTGADHPDIFGSDYSSIFDDASARDEYYRRMRQERYESGAAADEFDPIG